jgi:hypothetical protein
MLPSLYPAGWLVIRDQGRNSWKKWTSNMEWQCSQILLFCLLERFVSFFSGEHIEEFLISYVEDSWLEVTLVFHFFCFVTIDSLQVGCHPFLYDAECVDMYARCVYGTK